MVALTRGLPSAMVSAMSGAFWPVLFVWLDWPGAAVRAHTGVGDIVWGGHTWHGVGNFGGVTTPDEAGSMVATEATVSLVAGAAEMDGYLDDAIRNRSGEIYLGFVTDRPGTAGGATLVFATPVTVFSGAMDGLGLAIKPQGRSGYATEASLTLRTGPGARSEASIYHTEADQALRHPGDTAGRLAILALATAQKLLWPAN